MADNLNEVPFPGDPSDRIAIYEWHRVQLDKGIEKARAEIASQLKIYFAMFSIAFTIGGGLIAFAGWLGYKDVISKTAIAAGHVGDEVKDKIEKEMASDLEDKVASDLASRLANGEFVKKDMGDWFRVTTAKDATYLGFADTMPGPNFDSGATYRGRTAALQFAIEDPKK